MELRWLGAMTFRKADNKTAKKCWKIISSLIFSSIASLSVAFDTIDVQHTISGIQCRNGEKCTNEKYSEFYCYTSEKYWEPCCADVGKCKSKTGAESNGTFCSTTGDANEDDFERCREKPLQTTLSGRACANDSFCGFHKERYQWCWVDDAHEKWDYCCFPGSDCSLNEVTDGHFARTCKACQPQTSSCGKGCTLTTCHERDYGCNTEPPVRSVNNYNCVSPCSRRGTGYAWCYVKPNQEAWDWCCFFGETCGIVHADDHQDGQSLCYTKEFQGWPMECRVESEPTPLPEEYQSPSQPLEAGAIAGIVVGILFFLSVVSLLVCHFRKKR